MNNKEIKLDRLRYTKNKLSANLALLAILFNVFAFVSIYKSDATVDLGNFYYRFIIGVSIIYNLLFMLTVFLSSEGVKNYNLRFAITLIIVGCGQFIRINILPKQASQAMITVEQVERAVMEASQHTRVVSYLIISGVLCIIAGIIGIYKTTILTAYNKSLSQNKAN